MIKYLIIFLVLYSCAHSARSPSSDTPRPIICSNAIDVLSNASPLNSILNKRIHEQNFSSKEWYDLLNSRPEILKKYLHEKVGNSSILQRVQYELGEQYLVLLTHPGLLSRFDHFMNFAKEVQKVSPEDLYQRYSNHLGTIKLFRGMALENDQIAADISSHGIIANFIRPSPARAADILAQEFSQNIPGRTSNYILETHQHIRGGADNSRYLSTSHYIEVAASVGFYQNPRLGPPVGKRLYLFELEIPKIEVIEFSDYFKDVAKSQSGYFTIDNKKFIFSDPQVEYLIPFFIKKDWIKKTHRYENPPPPWRYFR